MLKAFLYHFFLAMISLIYYKTRCLYLPIFYLVCETVIPFLYKGITHVFLLTISLTLNKKQIPLLNLLINCISSRSTPQILSTKGDCTFLLSKFQIIYLCDSSANCLSDIFSFLTRLPEVFLSKKVQTVEAIPR